MLTPPTSPRHAPVIYLPVALVARQVFQVKMANGGLDLRQIKLGIRVVGRQLDIPVVSPKVLGRCVLEMPLGDEFLPCRYCRPQTYYTDRAAGGHSQCLRSLL